MTMNMIFKMVIFTITLNIASGLVLFAVPLEAQYKAYITPMSQQTQGQSDFLAGLGGNVTLPPATSATDRIKEFLLDAIFIGKILQIVEGLKLIIWGFAEITYNTFIMFTPSVGATEYIAFLTYIRTTLRIVISFVYGLGLVGLWTNKQLNQ